MNKLFERFESYLSHEKGFLQNTVTSYMHDATCFCASAGITKNRDLKKVSRQAVEDHLSGLLAQGKSLSSVQRARASLSSFFAFLISIGEIKQNPARGVALKAVQKKLPQTLSTLEVEHLLAAPDLSCEKGIRDKAMLELMYATGVKVSELTALDADDINMQFGFLKCRSEKGDRIIPLYPEALRILDNYMKNVRPIMLRSDSERSLFLNLNGSRLTRQGIWKVLRACVDKAGIKKNITPQTIRHSFARHLFENGADVKSVQEMLGHADIASTQFYVKMLKEDISQKYKMFHPRAR